MNKYQQLYSNLDRMQLGNVVFRYRILKNKNFKDIEKSMPKDQYKRLIKRKKRVINKDKGIRENHIRKFYKVNNDEDMKRIIKGIETLLRNKRRTIFLMGGNYEEVKEETKKEKMKFMTSIPTVIE